MHEYRETRFLPFAPGAMFDLVADVGKYPEFLPWCSAAEVGALQQADDGRQCFDAELTISYQPLQERFRSRVFLDRAAPAIEIAYLSGPFRHLRNRWDFRPAQQDGKAGTEVDFFIEFAFRSRLLGLVATPVFGEVARRMTAAFARRAEAVYGTGA